MPGIHHSETEFLRSLGVGGVILPGSLAWDTYPQAASPLARTPTAFDADTAYSTLVAQNALGIPYKLVSVVDSGTWGGYALPNYWSRWTFRKIGDASGARHVHTAYYALSYGTARPIDPLDMPANAGLEVAYAQWGDGGYIGAQMYALVLKAQPEIFPEALKGSTQSAGAKAPAGAAVRGTAGTAGGTAWGWGSYVQVTAGFSTPVLVTNVVLKAATPVQVAVATGAAGSEADSGIFGFASSIGIHTHVLRPFPLLVPANTRIAVRGRSGTASTGYYVLIECLPLPLY